MTAGNIIFYIYKRQHPAAPAWCSGHGRA